MRYTRGGFVFSLAVGLVLVAAGSAAAIEGSVTTTTGSPYSDGVLRKLGRGLANVATGVLEVPRTTELVTRKDGAIAGMTVGLVKGLWNGVVRELAGVYETVTFFVEAPKGFEPLVHPEFVWEAGNWTE